MIYQFMRTALPALLGHFYIASLIGIMLYAFFYAKGFAEYGAGYGVMAFVMVIFFSGAFMTVLFGVFCALLDIRDALERKEPPGMSENQED